MSGQKDSDWPLVALILGVLAFLGVMIIWGPQQLTSLLIAVIAVVILLLFM